MAKFSYSMDRRGDIGIRSWRVFLPSNHSFKDRAGLVGSTGTTGNWPLIWFASYKIANCAFNEINFGEPSVPGPTGEPN